MTTLSLNELSQSERRRLGLPDKLDRFVPSKAVKPVTDLSFKFARRPAPVLRGWWSVRSDDKEQLDKVASG